MIVSAVLPSTVEYVGGTVNSSDTVFDRGYDGTWTATVEQSDTDTYNINLDMVDAANNRSNYKDIIRYALPKFICDRTQSDVDTRSKKAFINAADLVRIDNNVDLISHYIGVPTVIKNDWVVGDIPRQSAYKRIRDNVERIRAGYAIRADTPLTPDQPLNTLKKWNDIERILYDVFWIYIGNKNNKDYCGEISAGEGIGII